jgi:hypothetical protein
LLAHSFLAIVAIVAILIVAGMNFDAVSYDASLQGNLRKELFMTAFGATTQVTTSTLTSGGIDSPTSTTCTTNSITPSANKLVLLAIGRRGTGTVTSVTGNGLTWVQVADQFDGNGSGNNGVVLFRAMGSSPTTGSVTMTFSAAQSRCNWSITELGNVDTSGTNGSGAIVQYATSSHTGGTTISTTLSTFSSSSNIAYGVVVNGNSTSSVGSGFGQLHLVTTGTSTTAIHLLTEAGPPASSTTNWYDPSWGYRKKITIDHTKVSSTLAYFPVLVSVTTSTTFKTTGNGGHVEQADGGDFVFTSSDGTTKLDHEIDEYSSSTGRFIAWVKTPSLSSAADTDLYVYYGNASAANQWNATSTWNENGTQTFRGVWHLNEASGKVLDSTIYNTSGTLTGTPTPRSSGTVGYGYNFNSASEWVDFGDPSDGHLDFGSTSSVSVSIWAKIQTDNGDWQMPVTKGGFDDSPYHRNGYDIEFDTNASPSQVYGDSFDGSTMIPSSIYNPSINTWYYVVAVIDRASSKYRLYVNGVQIGSGSNISTLGNINSTETLTFSDMTTDGGNDQFFGWLDEVRIASTNRSGGWIATEYANQSSPSTFETFNAEEVPTGGALISANLGTGSAAAIIGLEVKYAAAAAGDTTPPTVSLTAPSDGATVSSTVSLQATASDDVAVVGVQFKVDSSDIGSEDTTAPYSASWDSTLVANGSHSLSAVARDAAGNQGSSTISVVVSNGSGPWTADLGSWSISGNALTNAPAAAAYDQVHVSGLSVTDAVIDVRVKASILSGGNAGSVLRSDAGANRYQIGNLDFANALHRIRKVVASVATVLTSTAYSPSAGTYYQLRASLSGTSLQSWINGGTALSTTDSSLSSAGFIGLGSNRSGSAVTFTYDDFAAYTGSTITLNNLPAGGSWSVLNSASAIISCRTGSTWDSSTYNGQIPIDYAAGGGKIAVWGTNNTCSGGADVTYPSSGLATDIFGGDTYTYTAGGTGTPATPATATSSITISAGGLISY